MGQAPKEAESTVAAKPVFFIEWKTVASGARQSIRVAWSSRGKKGEAAVEDFLERCADTKVDIEVWSA